MSIRFTCSQCGKRFKVEEKYADKRGRCPCGNQLQIPNTSQNGQEQRKSDDTTYNNARGDTTNRKRLYVLLSFEGRIGRGTFLKWVLFLTAFELICYGVEMLVSGEPFIRLLFGESITALILPIVVIWPNVAMLVKRWHDLNRSLCLWLLVLIPFVNVLAFPWLLIEMFGLKGTAGENKFGPDPLGLQTT